MNKSTAFPKVIIIGGGFGGIEIAKRLNIPASSVSKILNKKKK